MSFRVKVFSPAQHFTLTLPHLKGALRLGVLEIGEVDQWGGMESREIDRNLRIVHCSTVQCSIAPGREAPLGQGATQDSVA